MKLFNRENILMYTVNKEKIGNNFSISVYNGEVVVSAPWYFTSNQIQKIVDQTLTQKQRAHPNKDPCCKLNVFFTEFWESISP